MSTGVGKSIVFLRGGGESTPFETINEFNVYWGFGQLNGLKSVFMDTCPYCLLSKSCFKKVTSKRDRSTPLPEDLLDKLKSFAPVCGISLGYETPNLPGPSWQGQFIVVEHLPLPEGVSAESNISIVFTGQIREKLEAIIEARQQFLREMAEVAGGNSGETRPDEKQGGIEDVGHGDWVIVEESDIPTISEAAMTSHVRPTRSIQDSINGIQL